VVAIKEGLMTFNARGLERFAQGIPSAVDQGAAETAADVLDERDNLVPIDTGALLDTGTVRKVADGHYEVREGDGLSDRRAHYTEYGTGRQVAQPHMTPAAERNRANLAINIAARLKALEKRSGV
jgi:hypothetical protein